MADGARLVEYSASSEEDEDNEEESPLKKVAEKRKNFEQKESQRANNVKQIRRKSPIKELLPLPDDIKNLFTEKENLAVDDPSQHDGRIRSFPHLEGNWATHVFVEVELNEPLFELQQLLFSRLKRHIEVNPMKHYHVSLSKTVTIRHHWINPLTDALSQALQGFSPTFCTFRSVKFFCNDEKTRTFLILEINSNTDILSKYICEVDKVFKEFNLSPFYANPSFHISIGWILGNVVSDLPASVLPELQTIVTDYLNEHLHSWIIPINEIHCRIGNKLFGFPLQSPQFLNKSRIHQR